MLEFRSQTGGRIGIFDELGGLAIIEGVTKGDNDETIHFVGVVTQGQLLPLWHELSWEEVCRYVATWRRIMRGKMDNIVTWNDVRNAAKLVVENIDKFSHSANAIAADVTGSNHPEDLVECLGTVKEFLAGIATAP